MVWVENLTFVDPHIRVCQLFMTEFEDVDPHQPWWSVGQWSEMLIVPGDGGEFEILRYGRLKAPLLRATRESVEVCTPAKDSLPWYTSFYCHLSKSDEQVSGRTVEIPHRRGHALTWPRVRCALRHTDTVGGAGDVHLRQTVRHGREDRVQGQRGDLGRQAPRGGRLDPQRQSHVRPSPHRRREAGHVEAEAGRRL